MRNLSLLTNYSVYGLSGPLTSFCAVRRNPCYRAESLATATLIRCFDEDVLRFRRKRADLAKLSSKFSKILAIDKSHAPLTVGTLLVVSLAHWI